MSEGPRRRERPDEPRVPRSGHVYDLDEMDLEEDAPGPELLGRLQRALDGPVPRPRGSQARREPTTTHRRLATDPDTVERDLIKLVLTVVELVRQLMERQALRRVDQGDLSEEQEERIGMTLMLLEERMDELRERYDLTVEDLNLDLGPLGSLLPRNDS
ncbi:gas vesicle protein K [Nocardiopsis alkaliphila]|uniref:gas vesicle protein K n=1 Tax=Nocardiopsis alkaliphila TaxID=225762 RepID=UPI000348C506|nr:gas vesicle protein K [Nocardiopsis alkaliphila]